MNPDPQYEGEFVVPILYPDAHVSGRVDAQQINTYYRRPLTCRVVYKNEGGVEVIEIYFTLRLKLVKKVEETKCEHSTGTTPSRWKPASAKELAAARGRCHIRVLA
jgi:hypothetical protein